VSVTPEERMYRYACAYAQQWNRRLREAERRRKVRENLREVERERMRYLGARSQSFVIGIPENRPQRRHLVAASRNARPGASLNVRLHNRFVTLTRPRPARRREQRTRVVRGRVARRAGATSRDGPSPGDDDPDDLDDTGLEPGDAGRFDVLEEGLRP
jgi:hypothetical protein